MPKQPKCTTEQLEAELVKLKQGGFKCSALYIEDELRKRRNSLGKRATNDSPKHTKWREASKRYREKQEKPITDTPKYDEFEGA